MTDPTQDALHAERIARLTELARRVWPQADVERFGDGTMVIVRSAPMLACDHPRALDALEAALLVLAGEDRRARAQQFFEGLPKPPSGILAVGTLPQVEVGPQLAEQDRVDLARAYALVDRDLRDQGARSISIDRDTGEVSLSFTMPSTLSGMTYAEHLWDAREQARKANESPAGQSCKVEP